MATPDENLMHWLRDAHAMGKQAIESVENQIDRLKNYPELRNWAHEHVEAAKHHRELIKQCIERRGGSTSTLKDVAMGVIGKFQELTSTVMADEVLKNVIGDYSFKHYQIASYKSLIAAAEEAGDHETKRVCEGMLETDQQLADRLLPYIPQVTREFMRRDAADIVAKR
ncbi:MAG: ferritin-like domain-containing protein [Rhodoplanes sp.]